MKAEVITSIIVCILVLGAFIGIYIPFEEAEAPGPTFVSGPISSDTTWYLADSPYIVVDDVTVESGATLTIEPGVEVRFDGGYSIIVEGLLHAQGTSTDRITFTSNQGVPQKGDWYTIRLRTENNIIDYANIEYATYGVFMTMYGGNNILTNSILTNCKYDGVYITNSDDNTVSDCTISLNDRYGITIYEAHRTQVNSCIIQYNSFFGIFLNASTYSQITNCNISYNDGKGVLLFSNSHHTTIIDCEIYNNNNKGIDLVGTPDNTIVNTNIIANNGIGIDFGSETSDQWIENCQIKENEGNGIDLRGSSYVDILGCNISKNKGNGGIYSANAVSYIYISNNQLWNNIMGNGIGLEGGSSNVEISYSTFSWNVGSGLYFSALTQNNLIHHNNFYNNLHGIYFYASADQNTIHSNNVHSNIQNGVFFLANCYESNNNYANSNTIYDNEIHLNGEHGIYFHAYRANTDTNYNNIYDNDVSFNSQVGIYFHVDGESNKALHNNIHSNIVNENNGGGIYFIGDMYGRNYAKYNTIENNEIHANGGAGVNLTSNRGNIIFEYNNIENNRIGSNGKDGIYFAPILTAWEPSIANNNIIQNNTIESNNEKGIQIVSSPPTTIGINTLANNIISNNMNGGIKIINFISLIIYHNTVNNNYMTGLHLTSYSSGIEIENNLISNNDHNGILITENSNDNDIIYNEISYNIEVGLKIVDATGNQIHHNNFKSNTQNAYDSTIALNNWDDGTEGNYWSDYLGFDDDGDGFGEDPYVVPGGGSRDWHPFMNPLDLGWDPSSNNIQLYPGWNFISIPLVQSDTQITSVLSSIAGNYNRVDWFDASDGSWHSTADDLTHIDHRMGFWIHMKCADSLEVTGTISDFTSIQLYEGWNMVGFPSQTPKTIVDSLGSIADKCISVQTYQPLDNSDSWKDHKEGKPMAFNELTQMTSNYGYWMYVTEDCSWVLSTG